MAKHFEELWEDAESYFKDSIGTTDNLIIISELLLKINLYQAAAYDSKIPENDRLTIRTKLFGEIIMALTQLSLKDDINAYYGLKLALEAKS
jgi:hypothetical protein